MRFTITIAIRIMMINLWYTSNLILNLIALGNMLVKNMWVVRAWPRSSQCRWVRWHFTDKKIMCETVKKKKQLCEGWKWKSTTITDETLTFWSSGDNNIIGRRKSRAFTENPWRALRNGGAFNFTFFYILWLFAISFATEVIYSLSDYLHIWIVLAFYYRNYWLYFRMVLQSQMNQKYPRSSESQERVT